MEIKRIVCLANSRKISGRCIAGKEINRGRPGGWIRPIGHGTHEEVSEAERQYADGTDPHVLDIIDLLVLEHRPRTYQQENWLIDVHEHWVRIGQVRYVDLAKYADCPGRLWINGHSTRTGRNDAIPLDRAEQLRTSLALVQVADLSLHVFAPGVDFGNRKRRVQAHFTYGHDRYRLWVTDPAVERKYLAQSDGDYSLGEAFLCISLSEPHQENCYKLVAAVIRPPQMAL